MIRVKMLCNLGWLHGDANGISDELREQLVEDAIVDVDEKTAAILITKLKCAKEIKPTAKKGSDK